jgi:hypothetical protein
VFDGCWAAHAAFRRALDRRHLAQAIAAAHDLPVIGLADALELVLLAADRDPPTYDRAAARWLARYARQQRDVDLAEAGLAHAALIAIRSATRRRAGLLLLFALAKERQTRELAKCSSAYYAPAAKPLPKGAVLVTAWRRGVDSCAVPRRFEVAPMEALGRVYFTAIFVGLIVVAVAVGIPLSAFIWVFIAIGAAIVVFWLVPVFILYGLPRLLRGRLHSEQERIQVWVFGVFWVAVFVAAPIVANVFFGVDIPIGDQFGFLLLIALVGVVGVVARRRSRAKRAAADSAVAGERRAAWVAGGSAPASESIVAGVGPSRSQVDHRSAARSHSRSARHRLRRALVPLTVALALAAGYALGVYDDDERLNPFAPEPLLTWGGETFHSKREFVGWLAERGVDYNAWATQHPAVAAKLDGVASTAP